MTRSTQFYGTSTEHRSGNFAVASEAVLPVCSVGIATNEPPSEAPRLALLKN
jgi:hypothetical protein